MEELSFISSIFDDSVAFVSQTLYGHKTINLIVCIYLTITVYISSYKKPGIDIYAMSKPLAKWKVWLNWLFSGIWGGHWEYLNLEGLSSSKGIWSRISLLFIAIVQILLSYKIFESQFVVVTILLFLLLFTNILCGIGRISYSTNKFNARYYRRYIDTDQDRGEKITKADLTCSLVEVGLAAIGEGISGIIDLNAETTNHRKDVNYKISQVTDNLEALIPQLNEYRAKFLRQVEVLSSLKEMNSAFIKVYEPLRKGVFDDYGGFAKEADEFIDSQHFKKQLGILTCICSTYSKINNSSK